MDQMSLEDMIRCSVVSMAPDQVEVTVDVRHLIPELNVIFNGVTNAIPCEEIVLTVIQAIGDSDKSVKDCENQLIKEVQDCADTTFDTLTKLEGIEQATAKEFENVFGPFVGILVGVVEGCKNRSKKKFLKKFLHAAHYNVIFSSFRDNLRHCKQNVLIKVETTVMKHGAQQFKVTDEMKITLVSVKRKTDDILAKPGKILRNFGMTILALFLLLILQIAWTVSDFRTRIEAVAAQSGEILGAASTVSATLEQMEDPSVDANGKVGEVKLSTEMNQITVKNLTGLMLDTRKENKHDHRSSLPKSLVPQRLPETIGRTQELKRLHKVLENQRVPGGTGKSRVANEFVQTWVEGALLTEALANDASGKRNVVQKEGLVTIGNVVTSAMKGGTQNAGADYDRTNDES